MNLPDAALRGGEPLGRREWIISSLLACGTVATTHQAQALASCLPLTPLDQEKQDPPQAKEIT
ncbi:MAG: hypothetical protein ACK5E3_10285, partial [Planctomycetota bacterium]